MNMFTAVRQWWQRVHGRRAEGPSVRSRVTLPAVVDVPVDVLRALRGQDARFDLYVLPTGMVWLLFKSDKPARIEQGRKELFQARLDGWSDLFDPMYSASLMGQGFQLIEELPHEVGFTAGRVVALAQRWQYQTPAEARAAFQAAKAVSDGRAAKAAALLRRQTRIRDGARDDWRWGFKRPVSI